MNSVRHVRVASMCGSAGITAGTGMPTIGKRVSGKNRHVPMQSGLLPDTITPATGMFLSKAGGVRSIALSANFALERQYLVIAAGSFPFAISNKDIDRETAKAGKVT